MPGAGLWVSAGDYPIGTDRSGLLRLDRLLDRLQPHVELVFEPVSTGSGSVDSTTCQTGRLLFSSALLKVLTDWDFPLSFRAGPR